jgi:Zn-dependent protease
MFESIAAGNQIIVFFVSLLIGMSVHEAMHAFTSHWLGDTTASEQGRLTLNPIKHIDLVTTIILPVVMVAMGLPPIMAAKPVPFNPSRIKYDEFGVALVGIAGPLTNLALACIGGLIFRWVPIGSNFWSDAVVIFTLTNVALFVFNMIPFPPLDGSRLLYAFAPEHVQRVMASIEQLGFGVFILIIFVLYSFIGPLISSINQSILLFLLGIPG